MKKQILFILIALVGGLSLAGAGCASQHPDDSTMGKTAAPNTDEPLKIAATIFPLYDIARTVAGEDAEAVLITPPGASPHFFEPTPSLLKELHGTDIVFQVGAGLDSWIEDITTNIDGASTVDLSTYIELKKTVAPHLHEDGDSMHSGHVHDHGHAHGEFDPHYWLDPVIAKDIAMHMAEILAEENPAQTAAYVQRANAFAAELAKQDTAWKATLSEVSNKDIATFHNAFMYFTDHFGLSVAATFEPFPGKEPTPQYIAGLQEEIDVHTITTFFLEPQMPKGPIQQFAKDNGLQVGVIDPIGGIEGRESYIDLITYNVQTIAEVNK